MRGPIRILPVITNCREVAGPESFTQTSVVLTDGSEEAVDDVILCTGYLSYENLPFIDSTCNMGIKNHYMYPVYRGMFHIEHPTLIFVGIWDFFASLPLAECMAMYVARVMSGKVKLPSKEDMLNDVDQEYKKYLANSIFAAKDFFCLGPERQFEYVDFMCKTGGYEYPKYPFHLFAHTIKRMIFDKSLHEMRREKFKKINDEEFEVTIA